MAKNFVYSGQRIHVSPSSPVASGVLTRVNGFIGIPLNNAIAGESVAFAIEGVWGLTWDYYAASQPAKGTILYWDTTASGLSLGAANDDFAAIKVVKAVSAANGSFQGKILDSANGRPVGQDQA